VLLMASDRDPIAPEDYARKAMMSLQGSVTLQFPDGGHQLLHTPCAASAAAHFLDNPAPNTAFAVMCEPGMP
jgi:hypothetical protein